MLKFDIRRQGGLIVGKMQGNFITPKTIELQHEHSFKDFSGLIQPQDQVFWKSSNDKRNSAVILKVTPLFPESSPQIGRGVIVTLDKEIPEDLRK